MSTRKVTGGAPLPLYLSFKGDGNWDDEYYGRAAATLPAGWRHCCFPDCAWMLGVAEVACYAHEALVGLQRVREAGRLADKAQPVTDQPFDYEMAVEALVADMVAARDARLFA